MAEVAVSDPLVVVGSTANTVVDTGLADSPRGQSNHTPIARPTTMRPAMAFVAMLEANLRHPVTAMKGSRRDRENAHSQLR